MVKKDLRSLEEKLRKDFKPEQKVLLRTNDSKKLFLIEPAEVLVEVVISLGITNANIEALMRN
jgi:hypothetical protein